MRVLSLFLHANLVDLKHRCAFTWIFNEYNTCKGSFVMVMLTSGANLKAGLSPCPTPALDPTGVPGELSSHCSARERWVAQLHASVRCVSGPDWITHRHSLKIPVVFYSFATGQQTIWNYVWLKSYFLFSEQESAGERECASTSIFHLEEG